MNLSVLNYPSLKKIFGSLPWEDVIPLVYVLSKTGEIISFQSPEIRQFSYEKGSN